MPGFVKPLRDYVNSPRKKSDADKMRQSVVQQAATALGSSARVCVYKFVQREDDKLNEGRFELSDCHGRPGEPRQIFDWETPEGKQFIEVSQKGREIVVSNIDKPPVELSEIKPNKMNGYGSFVLIPFFSEVNPETGEKSVRGMISIDYQGKRRFFEHERHMYLCIARVIEATFHTVKSGGLETVDHMPALYSKVQKLLKEPESEGNLDV